MIGFVVDSGHASAVLGSGRTPQGDSLLLSGCRALSKSTALGAGSRHDSPNIGA